jgi:hypothetical protein
VVEQLIGIVGDCETCHIYHTVSYVSVCIYFSGDSSESDQHNSKCETCHVYHNSFSMHFRGGCAAYIDISNVS